MFPSSKNSRKRFARTLPTAIAGILLTACATSTPRLPGVSPLVLANCPRTLGTLEDDSFGATTLKLAAVIEQYFKCRTAAVAE